MTANTVSWNSIRDEILANPDVKAEYEALSPEFEFAQTLITLREGLGLTQREFAAKVGMKQSQLARIESGQQTPKLQTLARLAAAAGYKIEVNLIPIGEQKQAQASSSFSLTPMTS
jgi:ribosome-binding protein aMBF1 (putative translation factor)